MATYNGEKYLRQQIDSILQQSYRDWCLYVHDDGSNDNTCVIIDEYVRLYPEKIIRLDYPTQGGACNNFLSLLERVESEYYMFSDQDDVWHEDKIDKSITYQMKIERENKGKPICIYSDLKVVDEECQILSDSFFEMEGIHPEYLLDFNHASASNFATGCTMLFNHQAKEVVHPNITAATMHDAWVALSVLKAKGKVLPIREALIDYRQHSNNTLGAVDSKRLTFFYRIRNAKKLLFLLWKHYKMLRALGFGSILSFLSYKIIYKIKIRFVTND